MQLRTISLDDLPLYERLRCNPKMMAELGGPLPREGLPEKLRRDIESVEKGRAWIFKVIPDEDSGRAAGHICIWESSWRGEPIDEIGWMILPPFQGRGLATQAARAILDKARREKRWHVIHAFPSTTNAASNALCRKMGFSKIEECDLEWAGRMLHCNHWRLDLAEGQSRLTSGASVYCCLLTSRARWLTCKGLRFPFRGAPRSCLRMWRASQPYGSDSAGFQPACGNPTEAGPLISTEQQLLSRDHEFLFHFATAFWLRLGGRLGQAQRLVYAEEALFNSF